MELTTRESSLKAYFSTDSNAESCASALNEAGIKNVQLEMVSGYGMEQGSGLNNPMAKLVRSMTGLNISPIDTNILTDNDSRELMVGDPLIYSMGGEVAGRQAFMLSAVIGEDKTGEAENIIKEHGGQIK